MVGQRQSWLRNLFFILSGAVIVVIATLSIRTLAFISKQINVPAAPMADLDRDALALRLSRAIQIPTVARLPLGKTEEIEFLRFHQFLARAFPKAHGVLKREPVGRYSLLYTWRGTDDHLKPLLLMGHMDVVPVDPESEKKWTHPPFSGRITNGFIWGRGAMDDKVGVLGLLEAVEHLLAEGFKPRQTIYLAFGHDEETGGRKGAAKIAHLLQARQVELDWVLDEGGTFLEGMVPGTAAPIAYIAIAEKGYVSLELTVDAPGGHASMPPAQTAIGILSSAIHKLERNPFPTRLAQPTREFLEFIAPEMGWLRRMIFANLWLFQPLVEKELVRSPATAALVRTTQAATIFHSGDEDNVLPAHARAVINFRILPGETVASVRAHVRRTIADPRVSIDLEKPPTEPSSVSNVESAGFTSLQTTARQTMPEAIVVPALLVASTDSRHYAGLTRSIFRFVPFTLRPEDVRRFHGIDERIALADYERCVRFFINLIRNANPEN